MNELERAIEAITYENKKFLVEDIKQIIEQKEEAIPYLRGAIEKAIEETDELDEDYQLHFYGLFLLGQFQDRECFPEIIRLVSLSEDVVDYLLGDLITNGLDSILYHTYNGDIELLKQTAVNEEIDGFVRGDILHVMGQLYLDGDLEEGEWKSFIRESVYKGKSFSYFYNSVIDMICKCHFVDMLPEIRYILDEELYGDAGEEEYDFCIDKMFEYKEDERHFCKPSIDIVQELKSWAMFQEASGTEAEMKKLDQKLMRELNQPARRTSSGKIGRNDPCPCGSGKKYKHCCLNKPKDPMDAIESASERAKWLERYPYTGDERLPGRVYLADYFDRESIEIDKLLYLGLMHRPGLIWMRDEKKEEKRRREYLSLAFERFWARAKEEGIKSFEEYDQKYSIHYFSREWIEILRRLLKESGEKEIYREVEKCRRKMSRYS